MKKLPSEVAPDEPITRYIVDKKHFKPEKNEIKVDAFLPTKPKPELPERQTSVYRTIRCADAEIWSIGDRYVENRERKRYILARADLFAQKIYDQYLRIVPDSFPHPRHANIVNWPNEEGNEHRKAKALLLARAAMLIVRPLTEPNTPQ